MKIQPIKRFVKELPSVKSKGPWRKFSLYHYEHCFNSVQKEKNAKKYEHYASDGEFLIPKPLKIKSIKHKQLPIIPFNTQYIYILNKRKL